jgi:hypothetical protein
MSVQTSVTMAMMLLTIMMMITIIMTVLNIQDDEMGKKVARYGDTKNACETFAAKREGKKSLRRPEFKWLDNIKIDVK